MSELKKLRKKMALKISDAFKKANIVHTLAGSSLHVGLDTPENLAAFAKLPREQIQGKSVHEIVANLARAVISEDPIERKARDELILDHNETHHIATLERHSAGFLVPVQRLHAVTLKVLHKSEVIP